MSAPPGVVLSVERWIFVVAQTLRLPPRESATSAVLSPAVMVPSFPMVARPLLTDREPETDTPSIGTVAMEIGAATDLAVPGAGGGWFPGNWSGGSGISCAKREPAQDKQRVTRIRVMLL